MKETDILILKDAGVEALNLLGQTAAVSKVLLGDKLAAFQEAAEKVNEIPAPVKIPDPAAEPTVTILWSESDKLQDGETMPLSVANRVFEELDAAQHTDREKDSYTGGWYDKTAFRIDFTMNGAEGRDPAEHLPYDKDHGFCVRISAPHCCQCREDG